MNDYPSSLIPPSRVEPVPRRIRACLANQTVLDTVQARYVWERPPYPQYYVPLDDVLAGVLVPEHREQESPLGRFALHALRIGDTVRQRAAKVVTSSPLEKLAGTVRFDWAALDAWFEEDEQVFVHPRNPYVRVDALRSTRRVRVELDGVVVAESASPVLVFETGLPTRYYLNPTEVDWRRLARSDTVTQCPYKGTTSGYWSVTTERATYPDLAWSYDFPTGALGAIAGLVAFYNEKVDIFLDGTALERPTTHFS